MSHQFRQKETVLSTDPSNQYMSKLNIYLILQDRYSSPVEPVLFVVTFWSISADV